LSGSKNAAMARSKSRRAYCWTDEEPSRSHGSAARAPRRAAASSPLIRCGAPPGPPPGLLLDREVPYEAGVGTVLAERDLLLGGRREPVAASHSVCLTCSGSRRPGVAAGRDQQAQPGHCQAQIVNVPRPCPALAKAVEMLSPSERALSGRRLRDARGTGKPGLRAGTWRWRVASGAGKRQVTGREAGHGPLHLIHGGDLILFCPAEMIWPGPTRRSALPGRPLTARRASSGPATLRHSSPAEAAAHRVIWPQRTNSCRT